MSAPKTRKYDFIRLPYDSDDDDEVTFHQNTNSIPLFLQSTSRIPPSKHDSHRPPTLNPNSIIQLSSANVDPAILTYHQKTPQKATNINSGQTPTKSPYLVSQPSYHEFPAINDDLRDHHRIFPNKNDQLNPYNTQYLNNLASTPISGDSMNDCDKNFALKDDMNDDITLVRPPELDNNSSNTQRIHHRQHFAQAQVQEYLHLQIFCSTGDGYPPC